MICADLYPDAVRVFVDFGQAEVEAERRAVKQLFGTFETVTVRSSMPASADGVFVPARNLLFATLALGYGSHVVMGGMYDDRSIDKTPTAFREMSRLLTDMAGRHIAVTSPLFSLRKHEAVHRYMHGQLEGRGVEPNVWRSKAECIERLKQTWSCYSPGPRQCLECKACMRWAVAMRVNGIAVPMPKDEVIARYLKRLDHYDEGRRWAIIMALRGWTRGLMCVDIDGTLTKEADGQEYATRTPLPDKIKKLNQIYDEGKTWIMLYTARPSPDRQVTEDWLAQNGVAYHGLIMNKPPVYLYIDDRSRAEL